MIQNYIDFKIGAIDTKVTDSSLGHEFCENFLLMNFKPRDSLDLFVSYFMFSQEMAIEKKKNDSDYIFILSGERYLNQKSLILYADGLRLSINNDFNNQRSENYRICNNDRFYDFMESRII